MVPQDVSPPAGDPPPMREISEDLVAVAVRAPSIHNTQPWRFRVVGEALELSADPRRRLAATDRDGREMVISCGAALFGLRLAVRGLGYRPRVEMLPDLGSVEPLARLRLGEAAAPGTGERRLLAAMRRRHTHRGPFAAGSLPPGLVVGLQREAEVEGASLAMIRDSQQYGQLRNLVAVDGHEYRYDPGRLAEIQAWTRPAGSGCPDGVPGTAYAARPGRRHGTLPQRDFDLGRGWGTQLEEPGEPAATAVLLTAGDGVADWLRAGGALYRILLRAAHQGVFASLYTQVLEAPPTRDAVRAGLQLPGAPQLILQLGRAHTTAPPTPRRPQPTSSAR